MFLSWVTDIERSQCPKWEKQDDHIDSGLVAEENVCMPQMGKNLDKKSTPFT